MLSISFLPWILLILASVIAVPVALKMSPGAARYADGGEAQPDDPEAAEGEAMAVDDFAADPNAAEPFGDEAFG